MAHTNGVFFVDLESGSDTARSALLTVTVSNPSGSITRCNKTAHGLTTGAVVTLSAFTAWLNSTWKVTVVDADNFDLDAAVWQATADANGTVTPKGGSSKADAFRTVPTACTAASAAVNDVIRIMASPDPTSLGQNATLTNGSDTVTLTSAVTANIDTCDSAWTASANVTATAQSSTMREGTNAASLSVAAAFTTGLIAYKALGGATDFSAYQQVSFLIRCTGNVAAGVLELKLCSDAVGAVPVNTIVLPAILASYWVPIVIDTGAALGNSIQSVALYSTVDVTSYVVYLDNIIACKASSAADSLTHLSLIGKNTGGTEPWMAIESINGTTIKLTGGYNSAAARAAFQPYYYGSTATQTLYKRECIQSATAITPTSGVSGDYRHQLEFGWDRTAMTSQSGLTMVRPTAARVGNSTALFDGSTTSYIYINKIYCVGSPNGAGFSLARSYKLGEIGTVACNYGMLTYQYGDHDGNTAGVKNFIHCYTAAIQQSSSGTRTGQRFRLDKVWGVLGTASGTFAITDSAATFPYPNRLLIRDAEFKGWLAAIGSASSGYSAYYYDIVFKNVNISSCYRASSTHMNRVTYDGCTVSTTSGPDLGNATLVFKNIAGVSTDHKIVYSAQRGHATIYSDASVRHTAADYSWRIESNANGDSVVSPTIFTIARLSCESGILRTVKAWVRRSDADCVVKLRAQALQLNGVSTSVSMAAAINTWEELTISFTPTETGVIAVTIETYGENTASVWVDDTSVS